MGEVGHLGHVWETYKEPSCDESMKDWVETIATLPVVMVIVLMGCDEIPPPQREVDRKASDATTNEISKMGKEQKEMMVGMPKKKRGTQANTKKGDPGGGEDPGASGGGGGIPGKID